MIKLVSVLALCCCTTAFSLPPLRHSKSILHNPINSRPRRENFLKALDKSSFDTQGNNGKDEASSFDQAKLAAEISTPFKTIRFFIYGAFAASASIGGLTALTQLAASISHEPQALPLSQCLTNVGIDFAVVIACVLCYRFERFQQTALEDKKRSDREKLKLLREYSIPELINESRVEYLKTLRVRLTEMIDVERSTIDVGTLMKEAKQNIVLVAGNRSMLKDAMLRATANRDTFVSGNILVIPVVAGNGEAGDKGFGKPAYLKQGFIGEPVDEEKWRTLMNEEINDALKQGNENVAKEGIVLVISKDGRILRRGLGMPRWDLIREDFAKIATT